MRYRVIAKYVGDRRYILAQDIDGKYCLLVPQGMKTAVRPITTEQARKLEFDRNWVPATDHVMHTAWDLQNSPSYR